MKGASRMHHWRNRESSYLHHLLDKLILTVTTPCWHTGVDSISLDNSKLQELLKGKCEHRLIMFNRCLLSVCFKIPDGTGEMASAVKSIHWSCRGLRFNSRHPYSGSQPSLTPVPDLTPSSDFYSHQVHVWHTNTYASKTLIQTK